MVDRRAEYCAGLFRRGPDLVPRKQIARAIMMRALAALQWRDPKFRTGNPSTSKRAAPIRGAMMDELVIWGQKIAARGRVSGREGYLWLKILDEIAYLLDDKAPGPTRSTQFIFTGEAPNQEVPERHKGLKPACDDGFSEVEP